MSTFLIFEYLERQLSFPVKSILRKILGCISIYCLGTLKTIVFDDVIEFNKQVQVDVEILA